MARRNVVITGMGTINPIGRSVAESWEAALAGKSGIGRISAYDPSGMKCEIAGEVRDFDPVAYFGPREARRIDRFAQFALAACQEALSQAGIKADQLAADRIGVVLGTGVGGVLTLLHEMAKVAQGDVQRTSPHLIPMMLADSAPGRIAIEYGFRGPNMAITTACASATNALGEAAAMIRRGVADVIISGGTEAGISPLVMAGFANMGALSSRNADPEAASRPFERNRDGFVAAEGAGILVLESEEHARARGAAILAELAGYGASADAYHITAPQESGEGAVLAIRAAFQDASIAPEQIDYVNAHGTSTPLNDRMETLALKAVLGERAYKVPVSSTKSMTGHLLGAAGAIEAIFCIEAIRNGRIPPTINLDESDPDCDLDYVPGAARRQEVRAALSNSFGFGGHNAALIFKEWRNAPLD